MVNSDGYKGTGLFEEKMKSMELIIRALGDSHTTVFKGGLLLFGVCLMGLMQILPTILEYEHEAKVLRFEVEAISKNNLDQTKCSELDTGSVKCKIAKYKNDTNNSMVDLIASVTSLFLKLGLIMVGLGIAGWVLNVFSAPHLKQESQD